MTSNKRAQAQGTRHRSGRRFVGGMEQLEGRALLATLYVDGSYLGIENGSPAAPYRHIQAAIDATVNDPGSEIHIAAGTYEEDLTVAHSVKLLGPNAEINPNTTGVTPRLAEAVLVPKTNNPGAGRMVLVTASNVTIAGLTIDGDNPNLPSPIVLNGASVNSATGIGNIKSDGKGQPAVIDGLTVKNNIIQNLTSFAVIADINDFSLTPLAISRNNVIMNNRVDNIPDNNLSDVGGPSFNPGRGISIEHNFYADVTGNVITRTGTPIQAIFMLDNPGRGPYSISNNEVHAYSMGIYLWTIDSEVPAFDVANNRVFVENDTLTVPGNSGIRINGLLHSTGVTLRNNDVNGAHSGLLLQWTANTPALTVTGGTLDGNDYGVVLSNETPFSVSAPVQAILDGVTITGSHTAALRIMDALPTAGTRVNMTVLGTTALAGNARGAELSGSEAKLIESIAPVVTLAGPPPAQTTGTTASFPFTALDNVSTAGDLPVQYKLDNGPLASATSPIALSGLGPGSHTLVVQATDQAGNTGSTTFTWMVNAVPPPASPSTPVVDPASDSGSPGDGITSDDTPTFGGTAPAGNVVTLLDGPQVLGTTTADSSGAWSFTVGGPGSVVASLAGGPHSITATDRNAAGGVSAPSGALEIVVDRVLPTVSITGAPPNQTSDTSATFTFSATDNVTASGGLVLQYRLDNGGFITAASPLTFSNLPLGMHTMVVQATDAAGNTGSTSYSWTVTAVAPPSAPDAPSTPTLDVASDTGSSGSDGVTADNTPTFTGTAPAGTTVTLFADTTMLGTTTADSSGQWSFTVSGPGSVVPGLSDGRYSIRATATNAGGTSELSGARDLLIDTMAPSIITARSPQPNSAGWNRGNVVASYQASDAGSGLATSAVGTYTFTSQGANQSRVFTAVDVAGNTASATAGPVNIDKSKPSVSIAASPNVLQPADGRLVNVTVSGKVTDSLSGPGGTLSYAIRDSYGQVAGTGTAKVGADGTYSFALSLPAALNSRRTARTFTITVTAQDAAGNSKAVSTTVRVPQNGSGSLGATRSSSKAVLQRLAYLAHLAKHRP